MKMKRNLKVSVISTVVAAIVSVPKDLEKILIEIDIRERIDSIQNSSSLISAVILRIVLETLE